MITTPQILANKYRYIDFLGEGANGKTWLARTLIGDERVAIKSLKLSQIENLKSIDLFKREAEVLSSISVHGVPKFYQTVMDTNDSGECYLVQQYIDAPSIQSYIDNGRKFSEREALQLMQKVADILRQLEVNYKPPIIHRDIKPSNILCTMPEDSDSLSADLDPWLIDFGAVANPQKKQQGSTVAGTIGYMAPEQILGDNTIQADYYALGATILHMLTGVPPYQIPNELFVLDFKPVLKQNAPDISPYMVELLDYLLQKDPDQRPQDIDALSLAIKNVTCGKPPKEIQIQEKPTFLKRVRKRFEQFLQAFQTSTLSEQTKGYITNVQSLYPDLDKYPEHLSGLQGVQFTYVINNNYFTNVSIINTYLYNKLKKIEFTFPIECVVNYDPDNFAISQLSESELEHIIDQKTQKKIVSNEIPKELLSKTDITPDYITKTPQALAVDYDCICQLQNNGMIALDKKRHEYVNILTFIFPENSEKYRNRFQSRLKILSKPVSGLPIIYGQVQDFNNKKYTYLIRQYIDTPNIQQYIDNDVTFSEEQVLFTLLKIAKVLKELQSFEPTAFIGAIHPSYIHIDLDAIMHQNTHAHLWLTAFYLSESYHIHAITEEDIYNDTNVTLVTRPARPTEQMCGQPCPQSDYFALGATAFEMLTRTDLKFAFDYRDELDSVIRKKAPNTSAPMITLLKILLAPEVKDRPKDADQLIMYIQKVMNGYFPDCKP